MDYIEKHLTFQSLDSYSKDATRIKRGTRDWYRTYIISHGKIYIVSSPTDKLGYTREWIPESKDYSVVKAPVPPYGWSSWGALLETPEGFWMAGKLEELHEWLRFLPHATQETLEWYTKQAPEGLQFKIWKEIFFQYPDLLSIYPFELKRGYLQDLLFRFPLDKRVRERYPEVFCYLYLERKDDLEDILYRRPNLIEMFWRGHLLNGQPEERLPEEIKLFLGDLVCCLPGKPGEAKEGWVITNPLEAMKRYVRLPGEKRGLLLVMNRPELCEFVGARCPPGTYTKGARPR